MVPGAAKPKEAYPYGVLRPRLRALSFAGGLAENLPSGLIAAEDANLAGQIGSPVLSRFSLRIDLARDRLMLAAPPASVAAGETGTGDAATLARQLFQLAKRDPKLKIIPAVERELVIQALIETHDNQVSAAKLLGITRATLRKRIEKFGIQRELNVK